MNQFFDQSKAIIQVIRKQHQSEKNSHTKTNKKVLLVKEDQR